MPCRPCFFLLAVLVALPQALLAQGQDAEHEAQFRAADIDNSRSLSRQEAAQGMPKVIQNHFSLIDMDGDEQITPEELQAMAKQQAEKRKQRRAERLRRMQRHK